MNLKLIFIIWIIAFVIGSIVSLIRYLIAKRQFNKMVTEEIRRIQKLYKDLEQALTLYRKNKFEVYCEGLL